MATPPTIDYGRPEPRRTFVLWFVLAVAAISGVFIALAAYDRAEKRRYRQVSDEVKCASNLRQIGQAIFLYAEDNAGCYPPDLQAVFSTRAVSSEVATCPSTSDQKASKPTGLGQRNSCSYVYVGADFHGQPNPECVVVIEDPANHSLDGCNVLYADGHVDWWQLPTAMQILNDLAARKNPPSQTTTFTQATARQDYEKNWRARMPQMKMGVWRIPSRQATTQPAR